MFLSVAGAACMCCGRPSKASGELRLHSPPRWRELPKPHVFDLFYIDSLLRFARKKKHNQIFYNNFINGNTMEEGFEPAKEEAVRIFLEGGVPTSCWELRNRHFKTLWDRVSGVHEVHMGNNGQPLDCSLWMDYWVRFCEAFTSIRLWPGRTQTDPYLCQPFDCNNKMGGLLWEEGLGLLASPNCLISGKFRLVKLV